ncbi:MAG TPA: cytochrome c biogenesis protein CcdA, partial [Microbacteriaceae bacterium]|nr:cytochrome c biogenesis protein CcdA [Microbacteriaceae bacterium]
AVVLALSLDSSSATRGAILGVAYCLGLGFPFILIALGLAWVGRGLTWIRAHIRQINLAGGVLLIGMGILMATGVWAELMSQLQEVIGGYVPAI